MEVKVTELLSVRPYKGAVMIAPCNDITNICDMEREKQYQMAEQSALNTLAVTEQALEAFPNLQKFLLLEYPPRADSSQLAELNDYANFCLREAVIKSQFQGRIALRTLDNLYSASNYKLFGPTNKGPRYDGIHFRGRQGPNLLTNDVINALKSTGMTKTNTNTNQVEGLPTHNMFSQLT